MLANAVPETLANPNPVVTRGAAVLGLAASFVLLGACAGSTSVTANDAGGGSGGTGGSSGSHPDAGDAASVPLSCDNSTLVLQGNCTTCHTAVNVNFAAGLDLDSANVAARLVGKPTATATASNQAMCAGKGNLLNRGTLPATGILIDKIKNAQGICGQSMPLEGAMLAQPDLDCLQAWANGLVNSVGL
jgi:hypothetical protein